MRRAASIVLAQLAPYVRNNIRVHVGIRIWYVIKNIAFAWGCFEVKEYNGAVLFIDILGIGALTIGNSIEIKQADFDAHGISTPISISNQSFCAYLLAKFRKNLRSIECKNLKMAQLSDCAFLWSVDPNLVLNAARELMKLNLEAGVFCRAGLSFGQIVEPDKNYKELGKFICGEAVTPAVQMESNGKGARIFIDTEIGGQANLKFPPKAFTQLTNASDFRAVDEFSWFRAGAENLSNNISTKDEAIISINELLKMIGLLCFSPLYRWNSVGFQGKGQIGSSIERLSIEILSLSKQFELGLDEHYGWTCENFVQYDWGERSDIRVNAFYDEKYLK